MVLPFPEDLAAVLALPRALVLGHVAFETAVGAKPTPADVALKRPILTAHACSFS